MSKEQIASEMGWVAAFDIIHGLRPLLRDDACDSFQVILPRIVAAIEESLEIAAREIKQEGS